jgi:hypothetical protein
LVVPLPVTPPPLTVQVRLAVRSYVVPLMVRVRVTGTDSVWFDMIDRLILIR